MQLRTTNTEKTIKTLKQLNTEYLMNVDMDNQLLMELAYQDYLSDIESDDRVLGLFSVDEVA